MQSVLENKVCRHNLIFPKNTESKGDNRPIFWEIEFYSVMMLYHESDRLMKNNGF